MTEQTKTETADKPKFMGSFKPGAAFMFLFVKAMPYLTKNDLKYLANADEWADEEMENMINILECVGIAIRKDDEGYFNASTSDLFFTTSNHYELLKGVLHVAREADTYLKNPVKRKGMQEQYREHNEEDLELEGAL